MKHDIVLVSGFWTVVFTSYTVYSFQEQYQQLFETVLVFLESFDTYANFQM